VKEASYNSIEGLLTILSSISSFSSHDLDEKLKLSEEAAYFPS